MAKSAFAGEMRTKVTIQREDAVTRPNGYTEMAWESIFPGPVWCKWVNSHGTEVFDALRLELGEVVTLTMRYSPLVDIRCRVLHAGDAAAVAAAPEAAREELARKLAYSIISLDNVEDKGEYLEIKLRRRSPA